MPDVEKTIYACYNILYLNFKDFWINNYYTTLLGFIKINIHAHSVVGGVWNTKYCTLRMLFYNLKLLSSAPRYRAILQNLILYFIFLNNIVCRQV